MIGILDHRLRHGLVVDLLMRLLCRAVAGQYPGGINPLDNNNNLPPRGLIPSPDRLLGSSMLSIYALEVDLAISSAEADWGKAY